MSTAWAPSAFDPPPSAPSLEPSPEGVLTVMFCAACSYSRKGLDSTCLCPECGTPVGGERQLPAAVVIVVTALPLTMECSGAPNPDRSPLGQP